MSQEENQRQQRSPEGPSLIDRLGVVGLFKMAAAIGLFVAMTFFYTMIPIAGLGLWPFLFFGCVSLIVSVADDLGLYS